MKHIVLCLSMLLLCSCASLGEIIKDLAGTKKIEKPQPKVETAESFSETKNYQAYPLPERKYGRMNRSIFEEEAKVESDAGSLWVSEGQGSYLFSQNQRRLEGDVLNVNLEDQAIEQLNSKVSVISDLLKQKEAQAQKRNIASQAGNAVATEAAAATTGSAPASAQTGAADASKKEEVGIKQVPTRVIATYPDGSYRVKGTKNVMIGNREFQVLVTGLVRGNDIADDSISSAKLLDSKFDIITNRKVQ